MKNLLLTVSFALLSQVLLQAQLIVDKKNADRLYNPTTIRNPVLLGDRTYAMQLNGWLTSFGYRPGAEFTTVVSALPVGDDLPLDIIFRTGGNNLKNCLRIGYNSRVGVNSDDLPAQFSVTQYSNQSPDNSTLFMARGGSSHNVKTFRLFTDAGDVLNGVMEGNFTIQNGDARINVGNLFIPTGKIAVGTNMMPGNHVAYFNGSVIATTYKVEYFSNWPDYVFGQDYTLLPLKEQAHFIHTHKHLPEMPSAKEVAENGFDIPENMAAQLKEIEKLNLYIIELHEKLEVLSAKVEKLEKH